MKNNITEPVKAGEVWVAMAFLVFFLGFILPVLIVLPVMLWSLAFHAWPELLFR